MHAMTQMNLPFQIPGYRIVRQLGMGGMATVYLAVQESLKRPVAIKVLAVERAPSDEMARRFEHEARTIARLDHPHIVSIFDVGRTSNGQIYYTMPYLPNGDLSARNLRDQPRRVLEIMRAMAEALGCAHDKGIVHRDVKPENVLFDKLDRPLLADFGIALSNSHQPRVTREGATIGSSGYMSPEQARGYPLDGRSDFYSLGIVCYELLTGEMPFHGADALAVALAHIEQPVPRLPVTRRIWQPLIDRALAKQPDVRFQSAEELLATLDVIERRLQAPRPTGFSKWWRQLIERTVAIPRRQRAIALCALVLLALMALVSLLPRVPQRAAMAETTQRGGVATPVGEAPAASAPPAPADAGANATSSNDSIVQTTNAQSLLDARAQHLQQAANLTSLGQLIAPAGNNAADHYLAILADEPDQPDALRGITHILDVLGMQAAKAIASDSPQAALAPLEQGMSLAERARQTSGLVFAALVTPVNAAIEARRLRTRNVFDTGAIVSLSPLLPTLARIDAKKAQALEAEIVRPAELLRSGGNFHDQDGPTMAVMTARRAATGHIKHAFAIETTDVTRGAYARFAAATGRTAAKCRESQNFLARLSHGLDWRQPGFVQGDDHPVVCVSWEDADAYTHWLSQRTSARYRLPTRQEWLLAARLGAVDTDCHSANIGRRTGKHANCDDGYAHTAPVGRFPPTPPGLYDIAGNVSTWIDGCAKPGNSSTSCAERTFRGLSWHDDDDEPNSRRIDTAANDMGYANVGMRVVRELPSINVSH